MANALYPFPAVPYAATYCYPPSASAHAPPPGFFPAPPYAFPYPASASYPPNPWSTSSTPSESIFPAPSYDPSTFALQHHPIHFPYPQVPVPQPETTAPPATASNFSPSASSPSGEPTAPPPRGYATPPLAPSTAPTPSSPLPFPAPGPWKPPPVQGVPYSPAPYPYPPPTSAYTPASGSPPNRPTWPPPAPYPTPSTAQSTTKDERMTRRDVGVLQAHKSSSAVHPTKPVTCQADDLTKGYKTSGASLYGVHKHKGSGTLSKANGSTNHRFFMKDDAVVQAVADERVQAKNAILHRRQRKLLDELHARLDDQQARERTAVNTLQGQLAKLKSMASQLEISIGKRVSTVHATTVSSSSDICAAVSLSASSGCSQFDATAAAYVARHVFGKIPTPTSGQSTRATTPDCCFGHQTPVQSSCTQDGDTKLSCNFQVFTPPRNDQLSEKQTRSVTEAQNFGDMSDVYAEEVIDMSEKMPLYDVYADNDNSCSVGSCNVLDTNFFIQQDGEGKPETEHTAEYFSNPSENELPSQLPMYATAAHQMQFETLESMPNDDVYEKEDSACLNIISDVRDFNLELQQQDGERACNCPFPKASDSLVTRSSRLSVDHSMSKLRLLWDPGASASLDSNKSKPPEELSYVAMFVPKVLTLCIQAGSYEQQLRDSRWSVLVTHERRKEWDPGDTSLQFLFTTAAGATKLDYAAVYKSAMAESLCATTAVQVTDCMQYIASNGINHIMQSAAHLPQGNYLYFLYYNSVLKTGYQGMRYVWAFSIEKGRQVQWDPAIELIMFLYKQTHAHIIQLVDFTSTAADDFLQVHQPCLHICLYCPHSDPLQQLVCYSSMFSSSAMSMSTAATLHVSLVLSSGKTAQEEKYGAAMYQLLKPQIPMRKTSRIWDPGIEFILYELWWFSKGTGYVLRHLLAVKFGTPSYTYSSDTAANMYCPPANLIQQRRNTAALLQFGHSAVCVWDPGIAFVYQQGVQENHNGKQLLASSKNCLHIWEIDILFITFLPP